MAVPRRRPTSAERRGISVIVGPAVCLPPRLVRGFCVSGRRNPICLSSPSNPPIGCRSTGTAHIPPTSGGGLPPRHRGRRLGGRQRRLRVPGETYVTGIWRSRRGSSRPRLRRSASLDGDRPAQGDHFEVLLGLLKIMLADAECRARLHHNGWPRRVGRSPPRPSSMAPGSRRTQRSHRCRTSLLRLMKRRSGKCCSQIIDDHPSEFAGLSPDEVTNEDVHAACREAAASN